MKTPLTTLRQSYSAFTHKMCHWSFYPWIIWGLGAAFFFAEYVAHVSQSVMVPQLMQSFHVGPLSIGALSAYFWWPYLAMQIPVGLLVDRYGPRRLLMIAALLCGLACILFAVAQSIGMADVSRVVVGFSASFAFISTLKLSKVWFPPHRFGFLAGLTQAVGMFGAVVGQSLVAFGVITIGWRGTTWVIGGFILLLALSIGILVRDHPEETVRDSHRVDSGREIWLGLLTVLKNPQTWINGAFVGLLYAPTQAFAELWGPEYLKSFYGLSQEFAGMAVSTIFIGWAIGGPLAGRLSDYIRRRRPILFISALASLFTLVLIVYVHLPTPLLLVLLFLYGVANTGVGVSYAVSGEINPRPIAGVSMSFANMASVTIGALCQPLIGGILQFTYTPLFITPKGVPVYAAHAYQMALLVLPICLAVAAIISLWIRETHCLTYADAKAKQAFDATATDGEATAG